MSILVVAAGSALGGALRYLITLWTQSKGWTAFAWNTLIVNLVGCFLIALIMTIAAKLTMRSNLQLFLTTGIMGGLTTYSTFNYDTTKFLINGERLTGIANVGVTVVGCFVAGLLGIGLAQLLLPD